MLEDCGKYAKVANLVVKKIEEEHRCILVQLKQAKCEVEGLKGELVGAYSKIKFLELEIIQANVKVEHITTKKLDNVLSSQNLHMIRSVWAIPEKGALAVNPRRK